MSNQMNTTTRHPSAGGLRVRLAALSLGLLVMSLTVVLPPPVLALTITVTNANDSGSGSLRAAILAANGTPAADVITFAIPGAGVHTIAPLTALPDITAPLTINGYSQSDASVNTLAVGNNAVLRIVLSGASAPLGTDGLRIATDDSVVRGLVINGWQATVAGVGGLGVHILAGSEDNGIRGNFIGTNAAGTAAVPNTGGVRIVDAPSNDIGGDTPAARNTISGNSSSGVSISGDEATGNRVLGNYIGTNANGVAAVANASGVSINRGADDNVVGGTTAAARNVISGNSYVGVDISAPILSGGASTDRNVVKGNFIGLNAVGSAAIANDIGVLLGADGAQEDNIIGGLTPGSGNTISGNLSYGIRGVHVVGANYVQGNLVGTTPSGEGALGNGSHGISLVDNSALNIGGPTSSARNVISGNGGHGVHLGGAGPVTIEGNYIGTSISGAQPLPNAGHGVSIVGFSYLIAVGSAAAGAGNLIAHNALDGISVEEAGGGSPVVNRFSGNSIHSNGGLGIDLGNDGVTPNDSGDGDSGPNALQNYPELLSAVLLSNGTTRFRVRLDVAPDDTYTIEFFSNDQADPSGFGEGQTYLGDADIEVGPSGQANELVTLPVGLAVGTPVTATAIGLNVTGSTSEFSQAIDVVPAVRIDDVSQAEGDSGTTSFTITARLAAAAQETVTVDYETADDTASATSDYGAVTGTLTFTSTQTSRTITVGVNGDTAIEPDESFFVDLSDFSLGADAIEDGRGRVTVANDDAQDPGDDPAYYSVVLDRSASMRQNRARTINNYNHWLADEQQAQPDARGTMALFSSCAYRQRGAAGQPFSDLPSLTKASYKPACRTPLYDAIAKTINRADKNPLSASDNVVIVVYTDGSDNASKRWTEAELDALIAEKTADGWTFVWLGESLDRLIQNWRGT